MPTKAFSSFRRPRGGRDLGWDLGVHSMDIIWTSNLISKDRKVEFEGAGSLKSQELWLLCIFFNGWSLNAFDLELMKLVNCFEQSQPTPVNSTISGSR